MQVHENQMTTAFSARSLSVGQRVWVRHSGLMDASGTTWTVEAGTVVSVDDSVDYDGVVVRTDAGGFHTLDYWHVVLTVNGRGPRPAKGA